MHNTLIAATVTDELIEARSEGTKQGARQSTREPLNVWQMGRKARWTCQFFPDHVKPRESVFGRMLLPTPVTSQNHFRMHSGPGTRRPSSYRARFSYRAQNGCCQCVFNGLVIGPCQKLVSASMLVSGYLTGSRNTTLCFVQQKMIFPWILGEAEFPCEMTTLYARC